MELEKIQRSKPILFDVLFKVNHHTGNDRLEEENTTITRADKYICIKHTRNKRYILNKSLIY